MDLDEVMEPLYTTDDLYKSFFSHEFEQISKMAKEAHLYLISDIGIILKNAGDPAVCGILREVSAKHRMLTSKLANLANHYDHQNPILN